MAPCKREKVARLHIPRLGTPGRTELSTNGTCQPEKTENLASECPRRATYTVRQAAAPRSKENRKNRNAFQMFWITARFRGEAMLSTKVPFEFQREGLAPRHGFEPRFTAPKAAVLPLDDRGSFGGIEQH
jgi:hypothetical protein